MAQRTDEILLAWESLSATSDESGWRTIAIKPAGACQLRAGRRFPGNEEALVVGFPAATLGVAERLPDGQGFAVERVDPDGDGKTWIALARRASGGSELFSAMACDVAGSLDAEAGSDQPRLLRVFLGRVRAWQEFMRKGAQPLSAEGEVGLAGELTVLAAMVDEGLAVASAVQAWVGCLDGLRDFEIGTGGIEVKSTLSEVGFPARVGSLEQLDDSARQPLFVAGVRLRQSVAGKSLPDFIEQTRDIVRGDAEAESLLSERLVAAGYLDAHADRYPRRFQVAGILVIEVGPGFPRLTPATVHVGVRRAAYEIDLDSVQCGSVGVGAALNKLGAI
ncbi:PD-(D/E)XK motif protein [Cupriavidus necator]